MTPQPEEPVRLDLNSPVFQRQLFSLEKKQAWAVLKALKKLTARTWNQIYQDSGLKWEAISSRKGPHGQRLFPVTNPIIRHLLVEVSHWFS